MGISYIFKKSIFFLLWFFVSIPMALGANDLDFLEGFRDIRWQEDIKNIKNLEPAGDFERNWYRRKQEKLKIDNIDVKSIFYGTCLDKFHNEIFCQLLIVIKDRSNCELLKNLLFEKFGEGIKVPFLDAYDWFLGKGVEIGRESGFSDEELKELERVYGAKIWMRLEFNEKEGKGILTVQNLPIQFEIMKQKAEDEERKVEEKIRKMEEKMRKIRGSDK